MRQWMNRLGGRHDVVANCAEETVIRRSLLLAGGAISPETAPALLLNAPTQRRTVPARHGRVGGRTS